jgi:hypothetical protein
MSCGLQHLSISPPPSSNNGRWQPKGEIGNWKNKTGSCRVAGGKNGNWKEKMTVDKKEVVAGKKVAARRMPPCEILVRCLTL